jgi:magnesium transporter
VSAHILLPAGSEPEAIPELLRSAAVLWVDVWGPEEADVRLMEEVFGFHPLAIEDTRNQRQRPKAEEYDGHVFLILNPVRCGVEGAEFRELDVFVGSNYVVTVHPGEEPVVEEARRRLDRHAPATPGHVVHALLDVVVDGYFPLLDAVGEALEELEETVLARPGPEALSSLMRLKRTLLEARRVVGPQRDVLHLLTRADLPYLSAEELRYPMRDVYDHLLRVTDMLDTYREILTGTLDVYLSAVSNRLNQVVNRLTALTVVIGVLAVVTGFYGMNFERTWPPFEAAWGVPFILGLMAGAVGALLLGFRRTGWL